MTQQVAVVTDSSACLPADLAASWRVEVIPLHVIVNDVPRAEGSPGLDADVVRALRAGAKVTTSQPSVEECRIAFESAAQRADAVVAIGLSQKISGTVSAMRAAADQASVRVTIVDSETVAWGAGFAALSAAAAARDGGDVDRVVAEAARVARSSLVLFTVETLAHLKAGGRISPAVAAIGTALGIRPVLGMVDGEIAAIERVRTPAKARAEILARVAERANALPSAAVGIVTLAGDEELSDQARFEVFKRGEWPTVASGLSAVLGAHTGPGTLGAIVADVHPDVRAALATSLP